MPTYYHLQNSENKRVIVAMNMISNKEFAALRPEYGNNTNMTLLQLEYPSEIIVTYSKVGSQYCYYIIITCVFN